MLLRFVPAFVLHQGRASLLAPNKIVSFLEATGELMFALLSFRVGFPSSLPVRSVGSSGIFRLLLSLVLVNKQYVLKHNDTSSSGDNSFHADRIIGAGSAC